MERKLIIKVFFIFLSLFVIGIILYNQSSFQDIFTTKYQKSFASTPTINKVKVEDKNINLVFVGDIMLDRGVKSSVYKNMSGDYNHLFENTNFIKEADIAFANLEGPASENGRNVGSKYSFRFEPVSIEALSNTGFDIVSVANNHAGDWTILAFKDTLSILKENNILFIGGGYNHTETITPAIIERNGIKIGFLGFTDVGPEWLKATDTDAGILLANDPDFESIISNAKVNVDQLIVSIHWGEEYKPHTKRQEDLAHKAIDFGANLVIGHHPHIVQDVENYKNGYIFYSLGNFIFDQHFSKETMEGGLAEITLSKDKIIKAELNKIEMNKWFVPHKVEKITD